jgi:hypothetical protein
MCGAEAARVTLLLSALVTTLLVLVPVTGPAESVTVLSAALVLALSSVLLSRAGEAGRPVLRVHVSPDAPARDERRRRGSFRRQSSPGVPGRPRPRAPQSA